MLTIMHLSSPHNACTDHFHPGFHRTVSSPQRSPTGSKNRVSSPFPLSQNSLQCFHSPSHSSSKHPVPDSGMVWTGATCQRHITLPANCQQTLRVFANFTRPGVYNLQTVKVCARQEGTTDYHLQRWQRTSIIAVVEEGLGL